MQPDDAEEVFPKGDPDLEEYGIRVTLGPGLYVDDWLRGLDGDLVAIPETERRKRGRS
jgi:hypothetical protein